MTKVLQKKGGLLVAAVILDSEGEVFDPPCVHNIVGGGYLQTCHRQHTCVIGVCIATDLCDSTTCALGEVHDGLFVQKTNTAVMAPMVVQLRDRGRINKNVTNPNPHRS